MKQEEKEDDAEREKEREREWSSAVAAGFTFKVPLHSFRSERVFKESRKYSFVSSTACHLDCSKISKGTQNTMTAKEFTHCFHALDSSS